MNRNFKSDTHELRSAPALTIQQRGQQLRQSCCYKCSHPVDPCWLSEAVAWFACS
jgi:hypothetical protein